MGVGSLRLELFPGMTASVKIQTEARENVLRVPNAALRWRPPGVALEGWGVWKMGPDGLPRRVPVVAGLTDGIVTEITPREPVEQVIVGRKQ